MFKSLLEVNGNQIGTFVVLGVLVVAIIVMFVFSGRRRKNGCMVFFQPGGCNDQCGRRHYGGGRGNRKDYCRGGR